MTRARLILIVIIVAILLCCAIGWIGNGERQEIPAHFFEIHPPVEEDDDHITTEAFNEREELL